MLVTGATGGIGTAVARRLARRGARLLLHGRNGTALNDLAGETGGVPLEVDLAGKDGPEKLGALALAQSGEGIDVVVHSAGVGWRGAFPDMGVEDIERLVGVNLAAPVRLTRVLLPTMLRRGGGHICFVTSIAGLTAVAEESAYSASKAGLATFAEALRLEVARSGVSVSTVAPGAVRTRFFETRGCGYDRRFPRMLDPDGLAKCITDTVERDRPAVVRPRWLAAAPFARAVAPGAYRRLAMRFG